MVFSFVVVVVCILLLFCLVLLFVCFLGEGDFSFYELGYCFHEIVILHIQKYNKTGRS